MELNNSIKEICSYQNSSESQEPLFSSQTTSSNNRLSTTQTPNPSTPLAKSTTKIG